MQRLELTNQRICAFYKANPCIQFEAVNLIFVDLLEKILCNMNETMTSTINSQMLITLNDNSQHINNLGQSIASLKDSISAMNADNIENILAKIVDAKREYVDDVRSIIQTNTHEKIGPLLEKNNSTLIDKTTLIINDIIPRNQTQYHNQIQDSLKGFNKSMHDDTIALLKSVDSQSIKEFLTNFEIKSSLMLQNLQQPIFSFISGSEDRLQTNINTMKDANTASHTMQSKFVTELGDILSKFRNTTTQQQYHDTQLSSILTKMFSSAEIAAQHSVSNIGLVLLKRIRKQNVLIGHVDSTENVGMDETTTFLQLIDDQHSNGIFISQNSGISTKKPFQIEIHNNNIVVYIHNAEYSPTKIELAVNIIDNLAMKLNQLKSHSEDDLTIPKDILDSINNEYQVFMSQKNAVIDVFKESQKKIISQIDDIRFPSLDKYLSGKYSAPIQKTGLKCDLCKVWSGNNLKALAAHKRGCIRKNSAANVCITAKPPSAPQKMPANTAIRSHVVTLSTH
jgi:hypothetical protein